MSDSSLIAYLKRGVGVAGSQRKLAQALEITEQRMSRIMKGKGYPMGVLSCVRLAEFLNENPFAVLRACGRQEAADLLERVFGKPAKQKLTASQRAILATLEALPEGERHHLTAFLEACAQRSSHSPAKYKR